jgi:hypothetical protein
VTATRWLVLCLALALAGCLIKPDRVATTGDAGSGSGSGDGGVHSDSGGGIDANLSFVPRLISRAYWNDDGGLSSPGMAKYTYSLTTSGVVEGDLLVIIGNVDNTPTVSRPSGFSPLFAHFYGMDGQTYFAFYKRAAANEPPELTGGYTPGSTSGGATLVLLAIHGASEDLSAYRTDNDLCTNDVPTPCGQMTISATSMGVTTTVANSIVLYAAGVDWRAQTSTAGFTMPTDFLQLAAFSDKGTGDYWWTSQMVGWRLANTVGPTGPISGTISDVGSSPHNGQFWSIAIAVAPQ